jgi:hypothetical protein
MNYIDLINGFWQKDTEYNFHDREVALYFYLLKVSNSIGWKNPFGLSNALTIAKFGWGKSSFDTAKNRLKLAGLIDFKAGDGRGNVYQYELKVIEKVGKNTPLSASLPVHLSNTLPDEIPATSINVNGDLNKNNSIGAGAQREKIFVPPTIQEAKDFFAAAAGDTQRHNPWPLDKCYSEAADFHDFYTANGWVQGQRSKKLKDWQAAARKWIRNALKGTFTNHPRRETPTPALQPEPKLTPPKLSAIKQDINFLYETYCEDSARCTILSLDVMHYEHMKSSGMMKFTDTQVQDLERKAKEHDSTAEQDPDQLVRLKKLFAVLAKFEQFKNNKQEVIYVPG